MKKTRRPLVFNTNFNGTFTKHNNLISDEIERDLKERRKRINQEREELLKPLPEQYQLAIKPTESTLHDNEKSSFSDYFSRENFFYLLLGIIIVGLVIGWLFCMVQPQLFGTLMGVKACKEGKCSTCQNVYYLTINFTLNASNRSLNTSFFDWLPQVTINDPSKKFSSDYVEKKIHELINQERTSRGLNPLSFDEKLSNIARNHSKNMADNHFFAHESPDGTDLTARYANAGYNCMVPVTDLMYYTGGENIFQGTASLPDDLARQAVDGWMNSPGHRKNILTPEFRAEGIGVYGNLVTQDFC